MSQDAKDEQESPAPILAALTASAGKLGSLLDLLGDVEPSAETALVLVLQHREALDEAEFRRAVAAAGHELVALTDGAPIEGGRAYLPQAGMIATVEEERFRLHPTEQSPASQGVIDSFLVSLARSWGERAIVVALEGTDGDGTLGVRELKEAGGLVLAEETEESREGALGSSESPAALADAVLPVGELAPRLRALVEQMGEASDPKALAADMAGIGEAIATITGILRQRTGHDFHGYKRGTFLRRVQRRIQALMLEDVAAYVEALRARPEEAQNLFNDLLIGVTEFFRDQREWERLERDVIPKLFERKGPRDALRVWVVGCSTGEEAYSIAILLAERRARMEDPPLVQIFASDLDGRALAAARAGRYTEGIAGQMSPERLGRWFVKEGDTYHIVKELREMCVFSQHSLIKDAPFSRLDLVSCRNLLIYLDAELQERVIPLFHFALGAGGFLFLGNSENASRHQNLFASLEPRSRIFQRLDTAARAPVDFPFTSVDPRVMPAAGHAVPTAGHRTEAADLARRAERIAERHAPAYVVTDAEQNVLHFSDRMGPFLMPTRGAASLSLLSLVHPDLRPDLSAALSRAVGEGRMTQASGLAMRAEDHRLVVDLVVEPMREDGKASGFVVLFKEGALPPATGASNGVRPGPDPGERVLRLEEELRLTRERLQATIEEFESTNEELKSSNEEYQSLNEEMQSANEELETSKEELQSVNEELTTVNGELAHRVQELGRANSDLKNFLESTQIATLFLDNGLKVTNFTPAATHLFHLVDADEGRLIAHIKARVLYDELEEDARRVRRTLAPVEREVADPEGGAHYLVRILPYRTTDNFIAGVVVNFVDVTGRRAMEEALRRSEERLRRVLETEAVGVLFSDASGQVVDANDVFLRMTGYRRAQIEAGELSWRAMTPPEWAEESEGQMRALAETGRAGPHEKEFLLADRSRRWMLFAGHELGDGTAVEFTIDISARKRAEAVLAGQREALEAALNGAPLEASLGVLVRAATEQFGEDVRAAFYLANPDGSSLRHVVGMPEDYARAVDGFAIGPESLACGLATHSGQPVLTTDVRMDPRWVPWLAMAERFDYRGCWSFPIHTRKGAFVGTFAVYWRAPRAATPEDVDLAGLFTQAAAIIIAHHTEAELRQRAETSLRESEERLKVLVAELQHRTRNLMGVVRSVTDKTLAGATSLEDFQGRIRDRLGALIRVNGLLSRLSESDRVGFDELLRSELTGHGVLGNGEQDPRLRLDGPSGISLRSSTVQTLALGLHELATNALKHGALSRPEGRLEISWEMVEGSDGQRQLRVEWRETGVPIPASAREDGHGNGAARDGRRRGYGRELIERALPYQLKAETRYEMTPDGVRCVIALPVSSGVTAPAPEGSDAEDPA